MTSAAHERELGGALLRSVSRSFYLSLRFLPRRMRGAASLGYLLARATDTVADTEAVPAGERLAVLAAMGRAVEGGGPAPELDDYRGAAKPGEVALLGRFGDCLAWLGGLPAGQRDPVRRVLGQIVKGQSDDLRRFGAGRGTGAVSTLASDAELEEYAFDVAGCVGVFWTELGFEAFGSGFAKLPPGEMERLGADYGKGLQLLNILRDLPEDLAAGRCYLPGGGGAGGAELWEGEAVRWRRRCGELLGAGREYLAALRGSRRLRFATALPVLIGERTLARLEASSWEALRAGVKVPRSEVKRLMVKAAWGALW